MTSSRNTGARWCRRIATILIIAPAVCLIAQAAAPAPNPKEKEKEPAKAKAKEVASSPGPKAKAVAVVRKVNAGKGGPAAQPKLPVRPAKVVTAPTLTRQGLDALVEKHL